MRPTIIRLWAVLITALVPYLSFAQSSYDAMEPFGFATCTSRTAIGYSITGGGAITPAGVSNLESGKTYTILTADDITKDDDLLGNITSHDVTILDGSKGDFVLTAYITLSKLSNKTIIGINNAKITTKWYATDGDVQALEDAGVSSMSTSGGGGTLSNGTSVTEEAEYNSRQIMINRYGDESEWWRNSGVFYITGCTNIIIRNISFQGPGAMDLGGSDLVSIKDNCEHIWVDHCDFADGQDGNMDITNYSDFVTVSWCHFHYTSRSYIHQNTNLCGSSDDKTGDDDKLSITWAYNHWGTGCAARMPMARFGRFHMLNNYYTCTGNKTACMNPRKNSEFLIEGNYFDSSLTKVYEDKSATTVIWRSNNSVNNSKASYPTADDATAASTLIPYTYSTSLVAADVPTEVGTYAGATLFGVTSPTISTQPESASYAQNDAATALSVTASASNGGALSYQWYSNTSNSTTGATEITGATNSTYTPSTATAGTTYYFCRVSEEGYTTATSSIAEIVVSANNACDITLATVAGSEVSVSSTTINASVPYSYATTVPVVLTISGGASASTGTSFDMTLAAAENATASKDITITAKDGTTTQTYTLTLTRGSSATVLDAVGNKVTAGGAFSNSECTSSIAFSNSTEVTDGSDKSTSSTNSGTVYRSSDATDFSISLVSTSASKIVIGATSSGSSERTITGVYVDGTEVTSSCTIDGSFADKSTVHSVTISGLSVAQGSTVRFTTSGNTHLYYFEVTAASGEIKSKTPSDLTITSSEDVELTMGGTTTEQITTSSSNTETAITYSSSDESVATVSSTGLITAVGVGTATITVSQAANDTYALGSKTITVNVSAAEDEDEESATDAIYDLTGKVGSADGTSGSPDAYTANTSFKLSGNTQYIIITPKDGENFKNGDYVEITGSCGRDSKNMGLYLATSADGRTSGSAIYTTAATKGKSYTATGSLTLSADADKLYLFRYDGTSTTITSLKVTRSYYELSESNDYASFTEGTKNVKLTKTFSAAKWSTICLPFSVSKEQLAAAMPIGTKVANISGQSDKKIYYTVCDGLSANVPALIYVPTLADDNTYTFSGVTVANPTGTLTSVNGTVTLTGVYEKKNYTVLPEDLYFLYSGKFYDWSYLSDMTPFTAYFQVSGGLSAKMMFQLVDSNDVTTGIDSIENDSNDAPAYNLNGQRVKSSAKGIIIKDGKKLLVK